MPSSAILHEAQQLYNVSDRLTRWRNNIPSSQKHFQGMLTFL
jgi:hypothetical protein